MSKLILCLPVIPLAACGGGSKCDKCGSSSVLDSETDTDADIDADTNADTDTDTDADPTASTTTTTGTPGVFTLTTPDMTSTYGSALYGQCPWYLPVQFSCDGPNPEISWSNVPAGTVSLLLLLQDPDVMPTPFPHWGVVNIPPLETGLAQGVSGTNVSPHTLPRGDLDGDGIDDGALELKNGTNTVGYYGSCPPSVHEYDWTLWALDTFATTPFSGSASQQFSDAASFANQHSLGKAEMCHFYGP